MYLTRMFLNPRRRGAMKLLGSPQAMHAAVMAGFPPGTETTTPRGRVLWRVDRPAPEQVALFIASPHEPCLVHLKEQAGWSTADAWHTRDYRPLLDGLCAGDQYNFRLVGNPTHRGKDSRGVTKVFAHVTVAQQEHWLLRKAELHGFSLTAPAAEGDGSGFPGPMMVADRQTRRFRRSGSSVEVGTARFDGVLEVTDPDALRMALCHGIGRAKAYGCGLMTLAPVG
ncbi:type I-E CRISPR-associated protein Cas6/Cse3/CasE [Tomitella fengzijianii]|uniref:Type I-E CRISPR-associated protein Cas6/Cse3/CasE n=1 Tax=Tomitella fengzijianii TaxID=2597660 RepID=A0A516X674_9ACTN|nr:type I-E CRISPR-associated protein Cas6/Cse3/CasE [Tomitella fengzijianii]QDQ98569.1 type I-E CRISPR-associated protein Cas6/Cse3/CasE [Tomitella fengzijianii]